MFDFIAKILAFPVSFIYNYIIPNYGWTIIIFTILLKLVTMPFSVKSQKSMAKLQQVQPLINEIQRKYANNREKQQAELMRIYDKYDISPTGGCMPMLLQLAVLMGFIQIVYKPFTFLLGIPRDVIIDVATNMGLKGELFAQNQLSIPAEVIEKLAEMGYETTLNLNFLGIDLSKVLSENMGDITMWILPVIALAFTILSTLMSQNQATRNQSEKKKNDPQAQQAQAMTKSMLIMMPVMTAYITYTWPLGCALYWIISTVTQMAQQFFINEFVIKKMKPIVLKKKKKPQVKKEVIDVKEENENDKND